MIKKYLNQSDTIYYISVFLILFVGLLAVMRFSGNIRLQAVIVVGISFVYVVWGILHHFISHDIGLKIVVKYVLIGAVGMSIVLFLLKGI